MSYLHSDSIIHKFVKSIKYYTTQTSKFICFLKQHCLTSWRLDFFFFELWCLYCIMMNIHLFSQEYKSLEIYAVTIKISMTEYHHLWHLINRQTKWWFILMTRNGFGRWRDAREYGTVASGPGECYRVKDILKLESTC